jgi:heme exporter protein B
VGSAPVDSVLRDAALVVGKDLRLEWRSRVTLSQLLPFALLVLILFAFALDPDRDILAQATPGLFWLAVLFSMLLAIQRAFSVETTDGIIDALRLSALDPAGIFLGKAAGIALHLLVLEVALGVGVTLLYRTTPEGPLLLICTVLAATAGLAASGALYGMLAAGLRVRDTLLPILMLPVVAPVLIAGTEAFSAAYAGESAPAGAGARCWQLSPCFTCSSGSLPSNPSWRNRDVPTPRRRSWPLARPPRGTASRGTRVLGTSLVVATALFLVVALVASDPDRSLDAQGELVRIMYVHVPAAITCYLAFLVTAVASGMYLWKRTPVGTPWPPRRRRWGSSSPSLTLVTGSIWGHQTWGTWWEWDPRLTSTALMFVMYLGYIALRRAILDPTSRAKQSAILGLVAFVNVPIVHYSVDWWRSLHQTPRSPPSTRRSTACGCSPSCSGSSSANSPTSG